LEGKSKLATSRKSKKTNNSWRGEGSGANATTTELRYDNGKKDRRESQGDKEKSGEGRKEKEAGIERSTGIKGVNSVPGGTMIWEKEKEKIKEFQ